MRYALPIFWCLPVEAQAKLMELRHKLSSEDEPMPIPPREWAEWEPREMRADDLDLLNIDKFMRQVPHHPARMR